LEGGVGLAEVLEHEAKGDGVERCVSELHICERAFDDGHVPLPRNGDRLPARLDALNGPAKRLHFREKLAFAATDVEEAGLVFRFPEVSDMLVCNLAVTRR
jgi:hypothetical protein